MFRQMTKCGCEPNVDTFAILLRAYFRKKDLNAFVKLYTEMHGKNIYPDRAIATLVFELFLKSEDAYEMLPFFDTKESGLNNEERILSSFNLETCSKVQDLKVRESRTGAKTK